MIINCYYKFQCRLDKEFFAVFTLSKSFPNKGQTSYRGLPFNSLSNYTDSPIDWKTVGLTQQL